MDANRNGVIITVYVESVTNHTKNNHHGIRKKKPKAKPLPKTFARRGYDRRSQLLAYAQSLRNDNGSHHPHQCSEKKKSWLKSKKWRFHGLCYLLKRPGKYNDSAIDEQSEVDCLLGRERLINLKKRKAGKTNSSQFWRRLVSLCIGLACAWQCNGGAQKNI